MSTEVAPTIDYDGPIPKTLRAFADRYADRIASLDVVEGLANRSGWGYDIMTRSGWCFDPRTHIEIADNIREAKDRIRMIQPCACEDCGLGRR